jgi:glycosyltransferase involved in cell wall biosynthesis
MITTFFGAHSFGGDAVFVDRLVRALDRRGHEVEVVHCADAFESVRGGDPLHPYEPPPGVRIHTLHTPLGVLSPLWTQQTGRPGPKSRPIRRILDGGGFDVVHIHNLSLVGGPALLRIGGAAERAVRLMTAHEYWLVCPTHVLWKYDRKPCDRPQCVSCTVRAGRPPQLWRYTQTLADGLGRLDALICPSRFSLDTHRRLGVRRPLVHLPYFLPDGWASLAGEPNGEQCARPYVAAAGRLIKLKGFQNLIASMARLPELDLRIAGSGPYGDELRRLAAPLPNVRFEGLLDAAALATLFRGAVAVAVPSLSWESFGYVVLEAFAVGTPAVVRRRGALPELVDGSGGGFVCDSDDEIVRALRRLAEDSTLRSELGERGRIAATTTWSESWHVERYAELIERAAERRGAGAGRRQLAAAAVRT